MFAKRDLYLCFYAGCEYLAQCITNRAGEVIDDRFCSQQCADQYAQDNYEPDFI
jgi:hypothetical protein